MLLLGFLVFLVVSHFGLMQIFRLTTYHAYFWKALPLLIGYSVLVGWLLFAFDLHRFFLWQVILASLWLFLVARKQAKTADAMLQVSGDNAESVRLTASSLSKTRQYYIYSSFIYIVVFSLTYLWLYNTYS